MSTVFYHRGDHAVIVFRDPLNWESAIDLVDVVDTVVDCYFYNRVELVVASPGGSTNALRHVLDALAHKRERGLRVRTRVLSEAASAAAVLACLGDERVAGRSARLLFHPARIPAVEDVTARDSAEIGTMLRKTDTALVSALVERVLGVAVDADAASRCAAVRSDRHTLERLWGETAKARAGAAPPRKRRRLARALGRTVGEAIRARDHDTLARIYRAVFAIERPVSAQLAFTLFLIDRVGSSEAAPERSSEEVGLVVPEWKALYAPHGEVPRSALTRHALGLGETGSGKTASAILPVVAALARVGPERAGPALIIDPKRELLPVLEALAPERLHHVRAADVALNIMAGPRWSVAGDLEAGRWLSAARRILCRAASFVRSSPARCLLDHEVTNQNTEFFDREGTSFVLTLLAFVLLLLHSPRLADSVSWLVPDADHSDHSRPESVEYRAAIVSSDAWPSPQPTPEPDPHGWVEEFRRRARGGDAARGPNALALVAWLLDGPALDTKSGSGWVIARIARAMHGALRPAASSETSDLIARLTGYWPAMLGVTSQFAGVRATASVICSDFATPSIASTLYFGCEPGYQPDGLDFARAVSPHGDAPLVLFQPARDGLDNLVAVALKAAFFEAVLDDPDRTHRGASAPLAGYIADEFHRYATADPIHGEQSFLDTCRSFGVFCLLACQSVASIEHALAHGSATDAANRAAVSILWNNTATKLVFRSTDPHTAERINELCPYRPGLAGVTRVRPVSTLAPGECYAVLADSRFERRQLEPYVLPQSSVR